MASFDTTHAGRLVIIAASSVLYTVSMSYAHGGRPGHIDEGPGLPTWITVVMVVSWVLIALAVVFFVLRLIRQRDPGRQRKHKEE